MGREMVWGTRLSLQISLIQDWCLTISGIQCQVFEMEKLKLSTNAKIATIMVVAVALVMVVSWLIGPASN